MSNNEEAMLESTIKSCEKDFGKGAVMYMSSSKAMDINKGDIIPSTSISLNKALGIGGIARGRIVEVFGPESSGKTTLALDFIVQCQKLGGKTLFVDAEHALEKKWCAILGVDFNRCLISQPDDGEQALTIVDKFVRSNTVDLIVVDSVAALVTKSEIDGEISDSNVAGQARLMSKTLRMLNPSIAKSKCCVIFVNQTRSKIGVMFGPQETTSGGNALKFYSSMRIHLTKSSNIQNTKKENIGNLIRAKVVKNKLAAPFTVCEIPLFYGKGFSVVDEIIDELIDRDIVTHSGAWYSLDGQKIGQGRLSIKTHLEQNPELMNKFSELILSDNNTESNRISGDENDNGTE